MVFLKWYLIACAAMTFISLLRVWGAIIDFRRRHPKVIFKKISFVTTVFNLIKIAIFFTVPLLNLITFAGFFLISDEEIEGVIISKCEQI